MVRATRAACDGGVVAGRLGQARGSQVVVADKIPSTAAVVEVKPTGIDLGDVAEDIGQRSHVRRRPRSASRAMRSTSAVCR